MSSSDSSGEEEVSFAELDHHLGAARYQLQILREDATGQSKIQMDKLYWNLNKGMFKMRAVAKGYYDKK